MNRLSFGLCVGFILTLVGIDWVWRALYGILDAAFGRRQVQTFNIVLLLGSVVAVFAGLWMLARATQPGSSGAGQSVCACGARVAPNAKFCANCGRQV